MIMRAGTVVRNMLAVRALTIVAALILVGKLVYAAGPATSPQASASAHPNIDQRAEELLQRACDQLTDANAFTFHAEVMFDQVLRSGVKLQFAGALDYAVQRPNELAIEYQSDLGGKRFWYDGKTVTLYDIPHKMYSSIAAPGTINEMMDKVLDAHHLSLPLGDMALSNACGKIGKQIIFGTWVGVNDVLGVPCDHLAFAANSADFQIWVQQRGKPFARKIVIDYRNLFGSPEYIAFISDWRFPPSIPQSIFRPNLPKDAVRIDFQAVKEK